MHLHALSFLLTETHFSDATPPPVASAMLINPGDALGRRCLTHASPRESNCCIQVTRQRSCNILNVQSG